MEFGMIYLIAAVFLGLYMTWGIGANDVANAMGTSVGSRAITFKQARTPQNGGSYGAVGLKFLQFSLVEHL